MSQLVEALSTCGAFVFLCLLFLLQFVTLERKGSCLHCVLNVQGCEAEVNLLGVTNLPGMKVWEHLEEGPARCRIVYCIPPPG